MITYPNGQNQMQNPYAPQPNQGGGTLPAYQQNPMAAPGQPSYGQVPIGRNSLYYGTMYDGTMAQFPFRTPQKMPTLTQSGTIRPELALDVTKRRPDSPWFSQQLGNLDTQYAYDRGRAEADNFSGYNTAYDRLASTGGIDTGARERLAMDAQRNRGNALAELARDRSMGIRGLRTQDFTNQVNADKYNIGNALGQVGLQADFDWNVFNTMAKAYGANQVGNAYARQQSGYTPGNAQAATSTYEAVSNPIRNIGFGVNNWRGPSVPW